MRCVSKRFVGVLLAGFVLVSCGRLDYTDYPVEAVEVAAPGGTLITPGGHTALTLQALPGPFVAGARLSLRLELGFLRYGDVIDDHLSIPIAEDGSMPTIEAIVPVNLVPGRILQLTSPDTLVGDIEIEVVEPTYDTQTINGSTFEVLSGFELDAPVDVDPTLLAGRAERIAVPAPESGLGEGFFVALSAPPGLARVVDDVLVPFFEETDAARAAERVRALTFPRLDTGYGDLAYLCTTRPDGVIAIDAEGASASPAASFPCSGLTFDPEKRLDYDVTFSSPLYFSDPMGRVGRVDGSGNVEILGEGLPTPEDGLRMVVCPKDFLDANTILISSGGAGMGDDGQVIHLDRLVPFSEPAVWLDGLSEPEDAAFAERSPFGWMMFLSLAGSDEVVGVRRDGSTISLVRGISEPTGLFFGEDGLWILGRGAGDMVRLRWTAELAD